jgi:hypothetical protein
LSYRGTVLSGEIVAGDHAEDADASKLLARTSARLAYADRSRSKKER